MASFSLCDFLLLLDFRKLLVEFVDTSVGGHEALLTGVEGMAVAAGIDLDVAKSGTSFEGGSAGGAGDNAVVIGWMDFFLHFA